MKLRLPERFVVTIEGKLWNVRRRTGLVPSELPYLLSRLLSGEEVATSAMEGYRLRVTIETDTDQGDDEPDGLVVGGSTIG